MLTSLPAHHYALFYLLQHSPRECPNHPNKQHSLLLLLIPPLLQPVLSHFLFLTYTGSISPKLHSSRIPLRFQSTKNNQAIQPQQHQPPPTAANLFSQLFSSAHMAVTRHATGSSRPRTFEAVSTEPATKRRTANKTSTGRVTKKAPATHHKRKPTVGDKVKGAAKKVAGTIERKPGKKAAGTAKMRGHDGKNNRTAATKKAAAAAPKKRTTKKEVEVTV